MSLAHAVQKAMLREPESSAPDVRVAEFLFDENFAGFDGHFPGRPMLPGIAQIMAVALTVAPEGSARLRSIGRTKFVSMVDPGDIMTVRATCQETGDGLRVTGECSTPKGVCAHIKIVLNT